jgi:HAD superfamily hydrolase (TIGR01549 family)
MNNQINHICFDLDGTLIDSYPTIHKATLKTLQILSINNILDEPEFQKRIGHHFLDIFNDMKIPVTDIEEFINIYKKEYFEFIDESFLYPGVFELLDFLTSRGIKISLLTTKGQDQAERIIDHFQLWKYFSYIMGRRADVPIKPSPEPLHIICREVKVSEENTLMVGDSELDIKCGRSAGAKTCAALYGYRADVILKTEEPDYVISTLMDLEELLKSI